MVSALLIVGLLIAVFVGFNIGGSSIGVAFGPAVWSQLVTGGGYESEDKIEWFAGVVFSRSSLSPLELVFQNRYVSQLAIYGLGLGAR